MAHLLALNAYKIITNPWINMFLVVINAMALILLGKSILAIYYWVDGGNDDDDDEDDDETDPDNDPPVERREMSLTE